MPSTTSFTNVTVPVGTQTVGPHNAKNSEAGLSITIDRTPAGGLNSLGSDTTFGITLQQSNDGGTTWDNIGGFTTTGGLIPARGGGNLASQTFTSQLNPGTGRSLQAIVTVGGPSSVVITATITTT